MQLGQASLGQPTDLKLGGYIPAPVQRDSVLKQALLAFLGSAAGQVANRAVGAGAQRMGALTPEEVLAQKQTSEIGRHNMSTEDISRGGLDEQVAERQAKYDMLNKQFGLNQQVELGNLGLGTQRVGLEGTQVAEQERHNLANEAEAQAALAQNAPVAAGTAKHLGAESAQLGATTAMQQNVQKQMAMTQLMQGMKPESPQGQILHQAAAKVPFTGDMDSWQVQVRAQAAKDAQAAMGSAPAAQGAPQPSSITSSIAEQGLLPAIGNAISTPGGGDGLDHNSLPGLIENGPDIQTAVNLDALKRFLMGGTAGPSSFDAPVQLNRKRPVPQINVDESGVPVINVGP